MTSPPEIQTGEVAHAGPSLTKACVLPAIASSALAVAVPSAWSLLFSGASYAGAEDEAIALSAQQRYEVYLSAVFGTIAAALAALVVLVFVAVLGATLAVALRRGPAEGARRRWGLPLALASVATVTWFGWAAERHPGLFLSTLSALPLAYWLLALARILGPLLALGSVAAWGYAFVRGPRRLRLAVGAGLAVLAVGALAERSYARSFVHRPYGARPAARSAASPPAKASSRRPNILWIAVDSLRSDKIDPERTPRLSRLLAESVYFPNALVTCPRTGPSWAASLTGLSPLTNGVETMFPDKEQGALATIALPAHLAALGYDTAAFADYSGEFFGRVELGFGLRAVPRVELREITGQLLLSKAPLALAQLGLLYSSSPARRSLLREPTTTLLRGIASFQAPGVLGDDVVAWLRDDPSGAPFFGLVFYSQPHFPYASNSPYYRDHHVAGTSSSIAFGRDVTNETPIASERDVAQIEGLYRGALAESDRYLGELLDRLESTGALDDTIIVLGSDHGEGLYECAECVGHGDNLVSMDTLRVPLAFRLPKKRYPNAEPQVVLSDVSQLDVYPSLLALLREPPLALHEGRALFQADGAVLPATEERIFFAETGEWLWTTPAVPKERLEYPPITELATLEEGRIVIDRKFMPVIRAAKHRAAIRRPYKLVYEPRQSGVVYRLFDFEADPLDKNDLAEQRPEVVRELAEALRLHVLRHPHLLSVRDFIVTRPPPPPEED